MLVLPVWTQVESLKKKKSFGKSPFCTIWGSGYRQQTDFW